MLQKNQIQNFPFKLAAIALFAILFLYINPKTKPATASSSASSDEYETIGLAPIFTGPTYQVEVVSNIIYGQGLRRSGWEAPGGEPMNLKLDAYLPNTPPALLRPAIMLFHGGGFKGGDKAYPQMVDIASYYSSRGWAVFSANYRLNDDFGSLPANWPHDPTPAVYPAGRDVKAAVRWLHANAGQYHVSRDHITVFGGSAGGMLAIMLGVSDAADYRDEIPIGDDPTLLTTNLEAPAHVQTVVSFWGGEPLLKALERYDGHTRYDSHDTPTLLFHGTEDNIVPLVQSERVFLGLQNQGVPVTLEILIGKGHSAWNAHVEDGRTLFQTAFDFIVHQQELPHE
jgi:para-nitrobenzyl esterase